MSENNDDVDKKRINEIVEKMEVPPMENIPKNIIFPNEITKIFYMLPLNDKQREELYCSMLEEFCNNPNPKNWFPEDTNEKNNNEKQ